MYTVAVRRDFMARHYLVGGDWGDENEPHAHQYVIEVQLEGRDLDTHGYLTDICDIESILEGQVTYYRDKMLNELPEFEGLNPSIEHLARIICHTIASHIQTRHLKAMVSLSCGKIKRPGLNFANHFNPPIWQITRIFLTTLAAMRIGLIIYGSLATLTGGYFYDRRVVEYLRECGHRVDVLSQPAGNYGHHLLSNLSTGVYSDIVNSSYDLLLQDELNHPSLLRMNHRLRKRADFPIVAVVHQVLCRQPRNGLLNRIYESIETRYLNSVDAFIFNSTTTRQTVEDLIARRRPSIVAFPAGDRLGCLASPDRIRSRARTPGPLRLIFVGNVLPNKGLWPLIHRLSRLPCETWQLTVVGSLTMDRRYLRRIEKLISTHNMKRQIELLGPRDGPELAALLARSHVFIMPYSHEGFGMAHLEAMAYALPVIGSASGALKEFVIPGHNGFLIDPADADSIPECLKRLNRDRQLLISMSHAALRTFHERPRWRNTVQAVHEFLSELMNQN